MPIQIPAVKRMEPQAPASVGRIDVQAPNASKDLQQNNAALDSLAGQAIKYRNEIADQTADTTSTDAENKLEQRFKTEMYGDPESGKIGLKFQKGNPTELYKNFDEVMQSHINDLTTNDQWNQETQNLVNRRVGRKAEQLRLQMLTEYGAQQSRYDDSITVSGVKLNQDALPDATSYIHLGDESTFGPLQSRLTNIRNLRIAQALRYGGAQYDANGEVPYTAPDGTVKSVTLGPATQLQIKKDLSDGLYGAMDNLIKSGALDKAQAMKDKYEDYLEPLKRQKLNKDFEAGNVKSQAFEAAGEARTKGTEVALSGLEPEVRHKALQIINDDQRNMEAIKSRASKTNYDNLGNYIQQRQRSDQPFSSVTELESDPVFAHAIDRVTDSKQKQAIYHMVDKPKESSPAALIKMQNLVTGQDPDNDITKMSPSDFALFKAGLNDTAQKRYDRIYEKAHTESGAQVMASYRYADKELADQMVGVGQIQRNQWGKFAGRDEAKWIQARQEMENYLGTSDHPMKPDEIKQHVREYVNHVVTQDALNPISVKPKFSGGQAPATKPAAPPSGSAPAPSVFGSMTAASKFDYIQKWRKANNTRETPSSAVLEQFIKNDTSH